MEHSFVPIFLLNSVFAHLGHDVLRLGSLLSALSRGRAALKAEIAAKTDLDIAHLPYDDVVVSLIREARAAGRQFISLRPATNDTFGRSLIISVSSRGISHRPRMRTCLLAGRRVVWSSYLERRASTTSATNVRIWPFGPLPIVVLRYTHHPPCGRS